MWSTDFDKLYFIKYYDVLRKFILVVQCNGGQNSSYNELLFFYCIAR